MLLTHGPERFPGAEKGPGQVDGEHLVPDLEFKGIKPWELPRIQGRDLASSEVLAALCRRFLPV